MNVEPPAIVVVSGQPIDKTQLRELVDRFFGDMVELVVDVRRRIWAASCAS